MPRTSTKTESERIQELQRKIAALQSQEAEKRYADVTCIQTLRKHLTSIQEQIANTKPLLASEGIRSFSVRIQGAELKAIRYKAERAYNELIEKHGQATEQAISSIMGEATQRLQKGESPEIVEKFILSAQKKYAKDNAEVTKAISQAMEEANQAIQACEEHSAKHTPRTNLNKEKAREFFRRYSSPFTL